MELNEPLYFTEKIRPICLPRRDLPVKYNSQIGTIAGWGKLGTSSGDWAANLQETNLLIFDNDICKTIMQIQGKQAWELSKGFDAISGYEYIKFKSEGDLVKLGLN